MTDYQNRRLTQLRQAYQHGLLDQDTYEAAIAGLIDTPQVQGGVDGSGAVAQGEQSQAAGQQAIMAGHDLGIGISGDHNVIVLAAEMAETMWPNLSPQRIPVGELRRATEHYLTYLLDRYRYLDFKGLGVSDRVPLRLPLVDMYIPLKGRVELPEGETWNRWQADEVTDLRLAGRAISLAESEAIGQYVSKPQPVLDLLRQQPGLILLGDPGAGKTTFLKYLTLCLAMGEGQALGLGIRLPILLPLSAYANALAEKDISLDRFIPGYYRDRGIDLPLAPMLAEALAQGRALLLLDGLDEVKEMGQRSLVVERVIDFFTMQQRCGNKFILTSRIVGYREVRPNTAGLIECTLVDFEAEEIKTFISKWTGALERAAQGDTQVAVQEAAREEAELWAAVQRNAGVRRLAANPLLLTILALMKRQGISLPERRVELYQKYVETLLNTWNLARGLGRSAAPDLDVVEALKVLAPLALWMSQASPGIGLVKREAMRRQLVRIYSLRHVPDPEQATQRFLQDVREYASLLLERGPGEYGFIHLTFQEYLAAVALAQRGQSDVEPVVKAMATFIGDVNWREVCLLAVGYMGIIQQRDRAAGELLWRLIQRSPGEPGLAVIFAGEAVLDAGSGGVTPKYRAKVIDILSKTVRAAHQVKPSLRAAAGDVLARLADPRRGAGLRPDGLPDITWRQVPAGPFVMGSHKREDPDAGDNETPQHTVTLPAYRISTYPITNAQYRAFVNDAGYTQTWRQCWTEAGWDWKKDRTGPETWGGVFDLPNHPVVVVTWYEAVAFCNWLTLHWRETGEIRPDETVSLPSERQWEKAARGTDKYVYPWGWQADPNRANYNETGIGSTTSVGCFPGGASWYGCQDMVGNVWEWCRTKWQDDYQAYRDDNDIEWDALRVLRGGSWDLQQRFARCAARDGNPPYEWAINIGFRVICQADEAGP